MSVAVGGLSETDRRPDRQLLRRERHLRFHPRGHPQSRVDPDQRRHIDAARRHSSTPASRRVDRTSASSRSRTRASCFRRSRTAVHLLASRGDQGTANVTIQSLAGSLAAHAAGPAFRRRGEGSGSVRFPARDQHRSSGLMSTVHADTPLGAYEQLAMMVQQAGMSAGLLEGRPDLLHPEGHPDRDPAPPRRWPARRIGDLLCEAAGMSHDGPLRAFYLAFCLVIGFVVWMLVYGAWPAVCSIAMAEFCRRRSQPIRSRRSSNSWLYTDSRVLQIVALGAVAPAVGVAGIVAVCWSAHPDRARSAMQRFRPWCRCAAANGSGARAISLAGSGSQILRVKDERHHLVIGPTRSGKGAGYVIPNALAHRRLDDRH